jgi:hypothetical protein
MKTLLFNLIAFFSFSILIFTVQGVKHLNDTVGCITDQDCSSYGSGFCCAMLRLESGGYGAIQRECADRSVLESTTETFNIYISYRSYCDFSLQLKAP